jgi:DNA-binding YbaB/EbfC family protein
LTSDGGEAGFDIGALFSQLGQVQRNLEEAQQAAAAEEVEGTSGGGAVKVRVSGALEFLDVEIDPAVVDPNDVEMLEDLVLVAVRDGLEKASGLATSAIGGGLSGLSGLPGLGSLPGLGGLGGVGGLGPGPTGDEEPEAGS